MAVTIVKKVGETDSELAPDFLRIRTRYYVELDDVHERNASATVRSAIDPNTGTRIPRLHEAHPRFSDLPVKRIHVRRRDDEQKHWEVEVDYEASLPTEFENDIPDPLNALADVRWEWVDRVEEAGETDLDGKPVTFTSGEPMDPAPQVILCDARISFTLNLPSFPAGLAHELNGSVNLTPWYLFEAKSVRVKINGQRIKNGPDVFFPTTFTFEYRQGGWQPRYKNMSLNEKRLVIKEDFQSQTSQVVPRVLPILRPVHDIEGKVVFDSQGNVKLAPVSTPQYLDSTGRAEISYDEGVPPGQTQRTLSFRFFKFVNFKNVFPNIDDRLEEWARGHITELEPSGG